MSGAPRSSKQSKQTTNNLVALGSAAVLAVYATGFAKTREAAARFADESNVRRPASSGSAPTRAGGASAESVSIDGVSAESVTAPSVRATSAATVRDSAPMPRRTAGAAAPSHDAATPTRVANVTPAAVATTSATKTVPTQAIAIQRTTDTASSTSATTSVVAAAAAVAEDAPARTPAPAVESAPAPVEKKRVGYADGVYYGWGTSRHGDIQAEVEIQGGRITSARIAQCLTRYSCSWISKLPSQVTSRQSPDVDYVSGATQSSNAFYYAEVDALLKAK